MVLEIFIENYRSLKSKVTFSLLAEQSGKKEKNVETIQLLPDKTIRVLKVAAIYGHNASGKSNILHACFDIFNFITNTNINVNDRVDCYFPFKFDNDSNNKPTNFEIKFIGPDEIRYTYSISFTEREILNEKLEYYPNNKVTNIFKREAISTTEGFIHEATLGPSWRNQKVKLFNNQSMIAKCGKELPHEVITTIFLFFKSIKVINAANTRHLEQAERYIANKYLENDVLKKKVDQLIQYCDVALEGIAVEEIPINTDEQEKKENPVSMRKAVLYGIHKVFDQNGIVQSAPSHLSLHQESKGTQTIYGLGGLLIDTLENGSIIMVDELQTSLHPFVSRLFIELFLNEKTNPHHAQLIFTSHESTLLNRDLLRRDQIWFTEKSSRGESQLFSLQDFDDVREDTPFDRWYLMGKMGAIPKFDDINTIFDE